MSKVKTITYQVQEQAHYMESWKAASSEVDSIDKGLNIKRNLQPDYPGVKFRIVKKTLTIEVINGDH